MTQSNKHVAGWRLWRRRGLLLTFGVGSALLLAELLLRLIGVGFPRPYVPDEHLGTRLQSNWSGHFSKEGRAFVQTNGEGFRDIDHLARADDGALRIAVLGDSYVEAAQVDFEETFHRVMQQTLQNDERLAGTPIEVLNFGVSGFGTTQELLAYRHYAQKYRPDIVLLAVTTGNDITDNSPVLAPSQTRPFFTIENNELALDNSFRQHETFVNASRPWVKTKTALVNRSRLLQLFSEIKDRARQPTAGEGNESGLSDSIYREPQTEAWQDAWQTTKQVILQLSRECEANGTELIVVLLTNGIQVTPRVTKRTAFAKRLGIADLRYANHRLVNFCDEQAVSVIDLVPPMQQAAVKHNLFFHGFANTQLGTGHWNEQGHQWAGEYLADELARRRAEESLVR